MVREIGMKERQHALERNRQATAAEAEVEINGGIMCYACGSLFLLLVASIRTYEHGVVRKQGEFLGVH
jgi:hypothetical protein